MIVYKDEIDCGVGEMVKSNTSVAYLSQAKPLNILDEKAKDKIQRAIAAANPNQSDLYYLDTILATTCCNLNKDIFIKSEMWAARHTAEDKPFNLGHVQTDIIGHITANFSVDDSFGLIPDNSSIDEVPDKFHILTSAVIYRFWEETERRAAIAKIIEEIQEGKWFVSMECLFSDFDYGLISPEGEQRIVARTEESSFLTKHLRQYGGEGTYDNYSLGRVLKNIKFSGKGLVEKPANKESIILTSPPFKSTIASVGYINSSKSQTQYGEMIMNPEELKAALAEALKKNEDLTKQVAETNSKVYTDQIESLKAKLDDAVKALENEKAISADKASEAKAALDELTKQKQDAEAAIKVAEDKASAALIDLERLNKEKRTEGRVAMATKAGASTEDATAFAEKHTDKSDEDFAEVISYATYKWSSKTSTEETPDKVLEEVTPPKEELVVSSVDNDFAGILEYINAAYKKEGK